MILLSQKPVGQKNKNGHNSSNRIGKEFDASQDHAKPMEQRGLAEGFGVCGNQWRHDD